MIFGLNALSADLDLLCVIHRPFILSFINQEGPLKPKGNLKVPTVIHRRLQENQNSSGLQC